MAFTNTKTPSPNNPSSLSPRYEIRTLQSSHIPWANAIFCHSNGFHSPVWPVLYPVDMTRRVHKMFAAAEYLIQHQILSGLSYGLFDTQYEYKTAAARKSGGLLYWDANEPSIEEEQGMAASAARMLGQMDFPLVSIALSYDAFDALDMEKMRDMCDTLPHFSIIYRVLAEGDKRALASWQATALGQVLFRNGTSTRHDYEGRGIMAGLARWLMREAALQGFRGIQIECAADAVIHVWTEAERPFRGEEISGLDPRSWTDEKGVLVFEPVKQRMAKIYVGLKPEGMGSP